MKPKLSKVLPFLFPFLLIGIRTGWGQFAVNGDAEKISCNEYRLTEDQNNQSGTVWNKDSIDLTKPFDLSFCAFWGCDDGGADGIAFVLQPVDTNVGTGGGGLGYDGISPSFACEFDTYENGYDPSEDHVAIQQDGEPDHSTGKNLAGPVPALVGGGNIENCQEHDIRVKWDPSTQEFRVWFDGNIRLTYTGDIINNVFGGDPNVFWGITGSTGSLSNEQRFCTRVIANYNTSPSSVCAGEPVQFKDSSYATVDTITDWAWDFGDGTTATDSSPSHTYDAPGTYDVELIVTSSNGCKDTTVKQVRVNQNPDLSVNTTNPQCGGGCNGMVEASASGGTMPYQFSIDSGKTYQDSGTFTGLCDTTHYLQVKDAESCTDDTSLTLSQSSGGFDLNLDVVVDISCPGEADGSATVSVSGGSSPYNYEWSDGQSGPSADNLGPGTYKCVVTDNGGCKDSITVSIDEPAPVKISAAGDTTICIGDSALLSASASGGKGAPYEYVWSNGLADSSKHSVSPDSSSTYEVYARDVNGCSSDTLTLTVNLFPPLNVEAEGKTTICAGDSVELSAGGSGGDGNHSYTWNNGMTGPEITVSPSTTTYYVVTIEDGCNTPKDRDTVAVEVGSYPEVAFDPTDTAGCVPLTTRFGNDTDPSQAGNDCLWELGDGTTISSCDSVSHTYQSPGCYDVSLTVTSPLGCTSDTTLPDKVCVYENPEANFTMDPQSTKILDTEIDFENRSTGADEYKWAFKGLNTPGNSTDSTDTTFIYRGKDTTLTYPKDQPGRYQVCLTAMTDQGCRDSTCKEVVIEGAFMLWVPNAFTPNGDGLNDEFFPKVQGYEEGSYEFYIFDRWGELIFRTEDPDEHWDGRVNGESAASDVYVWKVVVTDRISGKEKVRTGEVTLLR